MLLIVPQNVYKDFSNIRFDNIIELNFGIFSIVHK
jgi:hypothetical protein